MYRDEETLEAIEYYVKLPQDIAQRDVIVLDPMLATGNSTTAAIDTIKRAGASSVVLVSIIAAPEGIERLTAAHPDVRIVVSAVDKGLNDRGFIVPGLGDAGDRLFGTK
jgi:uracil phosphoribosyltransferase